MSPPPDSVPDHLLEFLESHGLAIDFMSPGVPMPTVPHAARAIGVPEDQILKTLLFASDDGNYVVVIVNGTRRIDRDRLAHVAAIRKPRPASPADVIAVTG